MSKKQTSCELSISSIPETEKLVHLFGQEFSALYDRDELKDILHSLIWCSYRKHFTPIAIARGPTSDSGWGCMHRVGQMVIARTLQQLLLPKGWIWRPSVPNKVPGPEDLIYFSILSLLEDNPQAPLSLHKITQHSGKPVGAQLSPDILGFTLQRLWHSSVDTSQYGGLQIVALNSAIVPVEDFRELGRSKSSHLTECGHAVNGTSPNSCRGWQPILAFVPCMLMPGTNHILRKMFLSESVVGFMGGYNSRALWIMGFIEDECFLALDPHVTQRSAKFAHYNSNNNLTITSNFKYNPLQCNAAILSSKDDQSFHTLQINRPSLKSLEGHSGSLALLFSTEESLDAWHAHFLRYIFPHQEAARCHIISITNRMPHLKFYIVPGSDLEEDYTFGDEEYAEDEVNGNDGSALSSRHTSFTDGNSSTPCESSSFQPVSLSPTSPSNLTTIKPVYAAVHLQNRLLYNDWFGKLYRFSDNVKQIFQREPSHSLPASIPEKKVPVNKYPVPSSSLSFPCAEEVEHTFERMSEDKLRDTNSPFL